MIRVLFFELLLFLAPFAVYGAYLVLVRRQRMGKGFWRDAPVYPLFVSAVVVAALGFVALATFGGYGPQGTYVPARIEDGKVTRGRIK